MSTDQQKKVAVVVGLAGLVLLALGSKKASASDSPDPGEPGGPPMPGEDPGGGDVDPIIATFVPSVLPGDVPGVPRSPRGIKPYEQPTDRPISLGEFENPDNYPTAGKFHQVEFGDTFFGESLAAGPGPIAARALYGAAFEAARNEGDLADEQAHAFARSVVKGPGGASRRVQYTDLIQCAAWNDFLYGTFGYGDKSHVSPHGRAIRLMPYHAENRSRIAQGMQPVRNIKMRTADNRGDGSGGPQDSGYSGALEYLWLPALNSAELWGDKRITAEGASWNDGSSMMWPPPAVQALNIDYVSDPNVSTFGCGVGQADLS